MEFLERLDQSVAPWFEAHQAPWLDRVMVWITTLGSSEVVYGVAIAAVVVLLAARRMRTAALVVAVTLCARLLTNQVKALVGRERPRPPGVHPTFDSFPSGHALLSAAVYITVVLVAIGWLRRPQQRVLVVSAGFVLVFLIGVSRLYLGVHYAMDVVAGWMAGLGLALVGRWLDELWQRRASARWHQRRGSRSEEPKAPSVDGSGAATARAGTSAGGTPSGPTS